MEMKRRSFFGAVAALAVAPRGIPAPAATGIVRGVGPRVIGKTYGFASARLFVNGVEMKGLKSIDYRSADAIELGDLVALMPDGRLVPAKGAV